MFFTNTIKVLANKVSKSLQKPHTLIVCATLGLSLFGSHAQAEYVDPADCGGDGQPACYLSEAKYLGQVKAANPGGGAFVDIGRQEWWTCDGWRRTIFAVTASNACETGSWPFSLSHKHARYIGPVDNPQPAGSFIDPRLDNLSAGAQYWRCPEGFTRNANPITHVAACSATIGQACDPGNIDVGNPIGGYTCYTKNQCGGAGERPCLIVERIPSCNSGLKEDFIDGKCIDAEVAQCLTTSRMLKLATGAMTEVNNAITFANDILEDTFGDSPIYDVVKNTSGLSFSAEGIEMDPAAELFGNQSKTDHTFQMIETFADTVGHWFPELARMKTGVKNNQEEIFAFLTDTNNCSLTKSERIQKFLQIIGYGLPADFDPALAKNDTTWLKSLFGHLAPEAHAFYGDSVYLKFGITLDASYIIGASYETYVAIDTKTGEAGWFMGIGPSLNASSAMANKGDGAKRFFDAGIAFTGGILTAPTIDGLAGWGGSLSITVQPDDKSIYSMLTGGIDIMFDDLAGGFNIDGMAFIIGFASQKEVASVAASLNYSHDWKIMHAYANVPQDNRNSFPTGKIVTIKAANMNEHCVRHQGYLAYAHGCNNANQDFQFKVVPGLKDSSGVSFESVNFPGHYLRHQGYRLKISNNDNSDLFKQDATFYSEAGKGDPSKYSFSSYNFPSHHIMHENFEMKIKQLSTSTDNQSATFELVEQ